MFEGSGKFPKIDRQTDRQNRAYGADSIVSRRSGHTFAEQNNQIQNTAQNRIDF